MSQKLPLDEFLNIYSKVPRLCVDLIITTEQGIVFSKRDISPGKGLWHLPGGTVFFGSTLQENAERIAHDETGLSITIEKLLGVIEYSNENSIGQSIALTYQVKPVAGTLKGSYQAREIAFFKEIPEPFLPEAKEFILQHNLMKPS